MLGMAATTIDYETQIYFEKRFVYSPINGTTPWEYGPCPSRAFPQLSAYYYNPAFYAWNYSNETVEGADFNIEFEHSYVYEVMVQSDWGLEVAPY